jgi:hypothetical protein
LRTKNDRDSHFVVDPEIQICTMPAMMRKRFSACLFVFGVGVAACSFGTAGEPSTGVDASVHNNVNPTPMCGDGICSASEANSCPQDCGQGGNGSGSNPAAVCGDGVCQASENMTTCPSDCTGGGGGAVCGDFVCQPTETAASCPSDCSGGGGGGPIDCTDMNTQIACLFCEAGLGCSGPPPVDAASCMAAGC